MQASSMKSVILRKKFVESFFLFFLHTTSERIEEVYYFCGFLLLESFRLASHHYPLASRGEIQPTFFYLDKPLCGFVILLI